MLKGFISRHGKHTLMMQRGALAGRPASRQANGVTLKQCNGLGRRKGRGDKGKSGGDGHSTPGNAESTGADVKRHA